MSPGLSASIWTALYVGLFQPRAIDFLLFLAFAPTALTLACMFFVNFVPFMQAREGAAWRKFMFAIQVGFTRYGIDRVSSLVRHRPGRSRPGAISCPPPRWIASDRALAGFSFFSLYKAERPRPLSESCLPFSQKAAYINKHSLAFVYFLGHPSACTPRLFLLFAIQMNSLFLNIMASGLRAHFDAKETMSARQVLLALGVYQILPQP